MLVNGIYLDYDNLIQLAYSFKNKIKEIENCYNSIEEKLKTIDGSNDTWQGKDQEKYYQTMKTVTDKYQKNIQKLTEIYNFLCNVICDYEKKDESFGKDLERNSDYLDM